MAKLKVLPFKRRRLGITDYRKRLSLLKSRKPRFVVRKSNYRLMCQLVEFQPEGDHVVFTITSDKLKNFGWKYSYKNLPAAYLVGYLFGKEALKRGYKEAILDFGRYKKTKGNKLFVCLKGAVDAGLNVPHSSDILPDEDRIKGKHIEEYYKLSKENFTMDVSKITKNFESVLEAIDKKYS